MYSNLVAWHVVVLLAVFLVLVLVVCAIVSISRARLSGAVRATWVLVAVMLPIAGPVAWFAVGRGNTAKP